MGFDLSAVSDFIVAHQAWAIPIIFLVVFAESFAFLSLLVPGTAILAACGALVGTGTLSLPGLLAGAIPGAILGDAISYWIGRRFGPAITCAWPLRDYPEVVAKAEALLRQYGAPGVFIGRFFGPLRAVVPLAAGIARMRSGPFWAANVASAVIWAPAVMLPGAVVGWAAGQAGGGAERWLVAGAVAVVLGAVACVLLRRRAQGRS